MIQYNEHHINYLKFGSGKKLLIAFHGFGDKAMIYEQLSPSLAPHYTVYAIDLPFHGATKWQSNQYNKKDIATLIALILKKEGRKRFSLMGFSLGGRLVLSMLSFYAMQIDRLFLLASDGIKTKGLANANLTPMWMRHALLRLMNNPNWFLNIVKMLRRIRLIDRFLDRFLHHYIGNEEGRNALFYTWFSLKDFMIYRKEIVKILNTHPIKIDLFFAKDDDVIPLYAAKQFIKYIPKAQLHILKGRHRIVNKTLDLALAKVLNK